MEEVVLVAGQRTPFCRAGRELRHRTARQMGTAAVTALMKKVNLSPERVQALVFGTVVLDPRTPNAAREIVFDSVLPETVEAFSVSTYCISGLRAITDIATLIQTGRIEAGVACGADSLSNPPLLFSRNASRRLSTLAAAHSLKARLGALFRLRPGHFLPELPGAKEPSTGLSMGQHCEIMAKEWKIARTTQDEIALVSHQRAVKAWDSSILSAEVAPVDGIQRDTLPRSDTSLEKLASLPPVFDRTAEGTLTAGNSSPLTDGGAAVLLMSRTAAARHGLQPMAVIRDWEYAAIDPADGLLMAPAVAVPRLLARQHLDLSAFDLVEVHEAFGAQVAANLKAWENGWKEKAVGSIHPDRLNVNGSSIALGHPFAATGGRLVTTLAAELQRRQAACGLISICAAGAMAGAMILDRA